MRHLYFPATLMILGLLTACSPSLEEVQERGFESLEQYEELKKYGETIDEVLDEVQKRGFKSLEQYDELKKYGETYDEVLSELAVVSPAMLESCQSDDYSQCYEKTAVWDVVVERYSSDGVHVELRNSDCSKFTDIKESVDITNLSKSFFEEHENACIKLALVVGRENWVTPDATFLHLLDVEPEEATAARVAGFESVDEFVSFKASGFDEAASYRKAKARGVDNPEQWKAIVAAEQKEAAETLKKQYGCVPTMLVEYRCLNNPDTRRQTQHYCFPISAADARNRVESSCNNSMFFRKGGGAQIFNVRSG